MNLVFSNYEVKEFCEFINSLKLKGKESRWRTKIYNLLASHYNEIHSFEMLLLKEYANLDENGNIKILDSEKGLIDMDEDNIPNYSQQLAELLNEEFLIACDDSNKTMIQTVGNLLLDGEFEVPNQIAGLYALWCDKFEEAIDFYNEKI